MMMMLVPVVAVVAAVAIMIMLLVTIGTSIRLRLLPIMTANDDNYNITTVHNQHIYEVPSGSKNRQGL